MCPSCGFESRNIPTEGSGRTSSGTRNRHPPNRCWIWFAIFCKMRWFNMFPWTPKTNKTSSHSECGFLTALTSEATHANIMQYSWWVWLVYHIFGSPYLRKMHLQNKGPFQQGVGVRHTWGIKVSSCITWAAAGGPGVHVHNGWAFHGKPSYCIIRPHLQDVDYSQS